MLHDYQSWPPACPRVRGTLLTENVTGSETFDLSQQTRGSVHQAIDSHLCEQSIPACAGLCHVGSQHVPASPIYPRLRLTLG